MTVAWGDTVVAAGTVAEGAEVTLGEGPGCLAPLPCSTSGAESVAVASWGDEAPVALVPDGVVAVHARRGKVPVPVDGPREIPLAVGDVISFPVGPLLITITADEIEQAPFRGRGRLRSLPVAAPHVAFAAALHALFIGLSAQAAEVAAVELAPSAHEEMGRYLAAAEERSAANEEVLTGGEGTSSGRQVNDHAGNGVAAGGARQASSEGKMGASISREQHGRYSVAEARDQGAEQALSREEAIADARSFGMVGLAADDGASSPFVSFGQAVAAGPDPFGARGELWSSALGEAQGAGGLGLSGTGEGGGGRMGGIGLGSFGVIGHGGWIGGAGTGGGGTFTQAWSTPWTGGVYQGGYPRGRIWGRRRSSTGVKVGPVSTRLLRGGGGDPADTSDLTEAVRRNARQMVGRFRLCYETYLRDRRPETGSVVSGSITTHLLIGRDGRVLSVQNGGATFEDRAFTGCVTRGFSDLSLPPPPLGETASAVIPIVFNWYSPAQQ